MAEVKCRSEASQDIDMEPAFPSPTNRLKCRMSIFFSFPVNSI